MFVRTFYFCLIYSTRMYAYIFSFSRIVPHFFLVLSGEEGLKAWGAWVSLPSFDDPPRVYIACFRFSIYLPLCVTAK